MKIAIVGTGYVGNALKRFLKKTYPEYDIKTYGKNICNDQVIDLNEAEEFDYDVLNQVDYVIFTAAVSSPDICANDYDMSYRINVTGTGHFIENSLNKQCRVIFLSSDAVFGFADTIVDENSKTVSDTVYGGMKKAIEDRFRGNPNFKSLRLSYVISENDKFANYLKNSYEEDTEVEVFSPFSRCCITMKELLEVINYLIVNWYIVPSQFINVCGNELISREQIAFEWNKYYNNKLKIKIVKMPEEFTKNRPAILNMKSLYLNDILHLNHKTLEERLAEVINTEERME
mgnify:CR=1 FL=1|jgi:dTDP-4-dehydrorhamnose reductase